MTTAKNIETIVQQSCARTHLYWSQAHIDQLPNEDADAATIAATKLFAGLEGRDAYVAWVKAYKDLIKEIETEIRGQKSDRHAEGVLARSTSQSRKHYLALEATGLIRIRRLGKIWSAHQRRLHMTDAA